MDYLTRVLGIQVTYNKDNNTASLPYYINARYYIKRVKLDGIESIFVYPKSELEAISAVKKHLSHVKNYYGVSPVLVLESLTYRQKEYLLRDHISFIVEGKQIYLPFMAMYLQERCDSEKNEVESILPSAQLLILYYIYHGCGKLLTSDASKALAFTPTSVSRASKQLERIGLIESKKIGVHKVISSNKTPKEMFEEAKRYLINPVKRKIYIAKNEVSKGLLLSGQSALSEYSMLNPPDLNCFASDSISIWRRFSSVKLQSSNDQCEVEFWRYDPKKLTNGKCVDRLSLALALREDRDERTEAAVEEMLHQVWRDNNGKRDSEF